jgi:hypothetical protein
VGSSEEINNFEHLFLDSIGLFRSEFIYLDRQSSPTLEDQKKVLSELSKKFKGNNCLQNTGYWWRQTGKVFKFTRRGKSIFRSQGNKVISRE